MGEVAEILKAAHEIFNTIEKNGDVPITVDTRGLRMAYAVPRGLENTAADSYAPWYDAELRQVFYKDSAIVQSVLAEIQLILTWRYSQAQQYIIEAYLTKNLISIDPTVRVAIRVRFDNPQPYDTVLEAYEIPFRIEVDFRPVGAHSTTIYRGRIRADGAGMFDQI
jgi:hypothetical protein